MAIARQLPDDPVTEDMSEAQLAEAMTKLYHKTKDTIQPDYNL